MFINSIFDHSKKKILAHIKSSKNQFLDLTFVQNFVLLNYSNDEVHIILKRRNLEICDHSSFFQLLTHISTR